MDGGGRFLRPLSAGSTGAASIGVCSSEWGTSFKLPQFGPRTKRPQSPRRGAASSLDRKLPHLLGTALLCVFFAVIGLTGAALGGHLQAFQERYGEPRHAIARMLGLGISQVTIAGAAQLTEAEILSAAGISAKGSLPFLDAADARDRLEHVPLIKSASVRKLYPNELIITLTEREPFALWQRDGELFVIAADGTVVQSMQDARFAGLPLVVGEDANHHTKDYLALLEAAGPLKDRIIAGTLVSGRRWTLKIDNGIDLRLPELGPAAAMARLVTLDREQKILDKDVIAIDLRMKDRVVVRLTEEAMAARLEALKKKPVRGKGVET